MGAPDQRLEAIYAAAKQHPLVHFALDGLEDDEDTFNPKATLEAALAERLRALSEPDDLLAAALGLFDLALVMQDKMGAYEASEVILDALASVAARIETASVGLPGQDAVVAALKARKGDGFGAAPRAQGSAPVVLDGGGDAQPAGNAGFDLTALPAPKKKG